MIGVVFGALIVVDGLDFGGFFVSNFCCTASFFFFVFFMCSFSFFEYVIYTIGDAWMSGVACIYSILANQEKLASTPDPIHWPPL